MGGQGRKESPAGRSDDVWWGEGWVGNTLGLGWVCIWVGKGTVWEGVNEWEGWYLVWPSRMSLHFMVVLVWPCLSMMLIINATSFV